MRKTKIKNQQLHIEDMKLKIGDQIYKDGNVYAVVTGTSENLYFLKKINSNSICSPYKKDKLVELILSGELGIDNVSY